MLSFLESIGLAVKMDEVPLRRCRPLPAAPTARRSRPTAALLQSLLAQSAPPVLLPEDAGSRLTVAAGTDVLAAAQAGQMESLPCAIVLPPLSAGVRQLILVVGQMFDRADLHPVLRGQALWLAFFWGNAQALYLGHCAEELVPAIAAPAVFVQAAQDLDGLCASIERYMATYFVTTEEYLSPRSGRVKVPWDRVLQHLPPLSETKRKALLRLFGRIPVQYRPDFLRINCPASHLLALAELPPDMLARALKLLQSVPPHRHPDMVRQIKTSGPAHLLPPSRPGPADAFPADSPMSGDRLPPAAFHSIIRDLSRINWTLRRLGAAQLTDAQRQVLFQVSGQFWELLDPLLEEHQ